MATTIYEGLEGVRLLMVQPLNTSLEPDGDAVVMADSIQSGPGDLIFWVGSREAALAMEETFVPVDAAIVGFVDAVGATQTNTDYSTRD